LISFSPGLWRGLCSLRMADELPYPSDYGDCTIRVEGVDADVRCTGGSLEVVFSRGGAPAELIDGFVSVRQAFQISKALSGLMQ
jgi:hypothetical protein